MEPYITCVLAIERERLNTRAKTRKLRDEKIFAYNQVHKFPERFTRDQQMCHLRWVCIRKQQRE